MRLKKQEKAENFWLEAFRSDTTTLNYLRLAAESRNFNNYRDEAGLISGHLKPEKNGYKSYVNNIETDMNSTDLRECTSLLFFNGRFNDVIIKITEKEDAEHMIYPFDYKDIGVILLLLYLYKGSNLNACMASICYSITTKLNFTASEYAKGTLKHYDNTRNPEVFWNSFSKWKKEMHPCQNVKEETVLNDIQKWISEKTSLILTRNTRNAYDTCALYIGALGEVLESRGIKNAKQELFDQYAMKYRRFSAFQRGMLNHGWKQTNR